MGFHESIVFGDQFTAQSLREKIQLNYLKVQVYYQTLNVRENREMKKYTVSHACTQPTHALLTDFRLSSDAKIFFC